jgi:hypothetical protein
LLPLVFSDEVPKIVGLPDTVARLSLESMTIEEVADTLADKFAQSVVEQRNDAQA